MSSAAAAANVSLSVPEGFNQEGQWIDIRTSGHATGRASWQADGGNRFGMVEGNDGPGLFRHSPRLPDFNKSEIKKRHWFQPHLVVQLNPAEIRTFEVTFERLARTEF